MTRIPRICSVEGCQTDVACKGYCQKHYDAVRRKGTPFKNPPKIAEACWISDCKKLQHGKKLCRTHYMRMWRFGDPFYEPRRPRHGKLKWPEYQSWVCMLRRCYDKDNNRYSTYGARGIRVCQRWRKSVDFFVEDMGRKPTKKHTIDRINGEGNYSCGHCIECIKNGWPANCQWATPKEQAGNKKSTKWIEFQGERLVSSDWDRRQGYRLGTVLRRIQDFGWSVEDAIMVSPSFSSTVRKERRNV